MTVPVTPYTSLFKSVFSVNPLTSIHELIHKFILKNENMRVYNLTEEQIYKKTIIVKI